jgi:hypothetical protein
MMLNLWILAAVMATAAVMWLPKVHGSTTWRAMTTPLASIIGSGFLVLGPLLDASYGRYAPLVMAALCIGAYALGSAVRYNIAMLGERVGIAGRTAHQLDALASWLLAGAYIISVAYYLNLFGAFGVSLANPVSRIDAQLLTSAIFLLILYVGWSRGFRSLELMEYLSVSVKLAIIAGMLVGMANHFLGKWQTSNLVWNPPEQTGWQGIMLVFGLVVTVQGFETSRYLGHAYDAATRIRSMKWAQWLSSLVYMAYILLLAYVFERGELKLSETAIVGMMQAVAPILPTLLVGAALAAQFSAAVADTSGSGGLFQELSSGKLSERMAYVLLVGLGLLMTWTSDVFQIIAYASKAFAAYYAVQSAIAAIVAWHREERLRAAFFATLCVIAAFAAVFGKAAEGSG